MGERVDVLAYDDPVDPGVEERKHEQTLSFVAWAAAAAFVGYGLLQGETLLAVVAAVAVLGLRHLVVGEDHREVRTRYRTIEAGRGEDVVRAHEIEVEKRSRMRTTFLALVVAGVLGWGVLQGSFLLGVVAAGSVAAVGVVTRSDPALPRVVERDVDRERAQQLFDVEEASEKDGLRADW